MGKVGMHKMSKKQLYAEPKSLDVTAARKSSLKHMDLILTVDCVAVSAPHVPQVSNEAGMVLCFFILYPYAASSSGCGAINQPTLSINRSLSSWLRPVIVQETW